MGQAAVPPCKNHFQIGLLTFYISSWQVGNVQSLILVSRYSLLSAICNYVLVHVTLERRDSIQTRKKKQGLPSVSIWWIKFSPMLGKSFFFSGVFGKNNRYLCK